MNNKFQIKTLRDIFSLPTYEQTEKCLEELSKAMLHARATSDLIASLAKDKGILLVDGRAFEWPEYTEWTDDEKGEIGADFVAQDGTAIMSTRITKSDSASA